MAFAQLAKIIYIGYIVLLLLLHTSFSQNNTKTLNNYLSLDFFSTLIINVLE